MPPVRGGEAEFFGLIVRGSVLCQRCGQKRRERVCLKCGYDSCRIRVSFKGKCYNIWHDRKGETYSHSTAIRDLIIINNELGQKPPLFDPKEWSKASFKERYFIRQYEAWLKQKKNEAADGRFSHATLRKYESYSRHHFRPLHNMNVREIRLQNLQECLDGTKPGLSMKYKKNMADCLKTFFRWMVRWGTIEKAPVFPEIRTDGSGGSRAITYTDQLDAIEKIPAGHRDIFIFMREEGLRVGEACVVKVKDLDLQGNRMIVRRTYSDHRIVETTKQRRKDWLPLTEDALKLAARITRNRFGDEWLFINPATGRGYQPQTLRKLWRRYSGLEITLYEAMRHSTITDWARRGNAYQVKALARHSDIRTSDKYVHITMADLKDLMDGKVVSLSDDNPIEAVKPRGT